MKTLNALFNSNVFPGVNLLPENSAVRKIFMLCALLFLSTFTFAQSNEYHYEFSKNNVAVYSRWTCSDCSDKHLQLKIINNNDYKVTVQWDEFDWVLKGSGQEVGHEAGAMGDYAPHKTQSGDYNGLYFYPPKDFPKLGMSSLDYKLLNFKVTVAGKN